MSEVATIEVTSLETGEASPIDASDDSTLARTHARGLPPWQQQFIAAFLVALAKRPIVSEAVDEACKHAGRGISRKTAYLWREKDEAFRDAWDEALERGWDRAEGAAYTRGVEGVEVPIVNRKTGEIEGYATEYSDRLLELLLKGNKAKTYRETHKVEVEHGLSAGMEEVLRSVRMRRQEANAGSNVRELPVSEVKTLEMNCGAQDGESCVPETTPESGKK